MLDKIKVSDGMLDKLRATRDHHRAKAAELDRILLRWSGEEQPEADIMPGLSLAEPVKLEAIQCDHKDRARLGEDGSVCNDCGKEF